LSNAGIYSNLTNLEARFAAGPTAAPHRRKSIQGVCAMQVETTVSLRFEAFRDKVRPGEWRVEAVNSWTGDVFVAVFCGPLAQARAAEYANSMNNPQS